MVKLISRLLSEGCCQCLLLSLVPILFLTVCVSGQVVAEPHMREITHFPAEEAHQGVAVDDKHFYAITNTAVGKYELSTGKRVAQWTGTKEVSLKHLNSGVVFEGKLYCAHSNWPLVPRTSSIEIWETDKLEHVETLTFDEADGALNWVDRYDGKWYGVFAHYSQGSDVTAADHVSRTRFVQFDADWKPMQTWTFPEKVWKRFAPSSNSGGSFAADGALYCTGHDYAELYVMRLPKEGAVLEYIETIPAPNAGQGIAWRLKPAPQLFGIRRAKHEVVQMELVP